MLSHSSRNSLYIVIPLLLVWSRVALSEEPVNKNNNVVRIQVRTVRAYGPIETGGVAPIKADFKVQVDPQIVDLETKLRMLEYKEFKLMSTDEVTVPLKKKEAFHLVDGNVLTVRPLSYDDDKVSIWLKWIDKHGTQIIDTRLYVDRGDCMLTGTDIVSNNMGLILAITAKPVSQ